MAILFDVGTDEEQTPIISKFKEIALEWEKAADQLELLVSGKCTASRLDLEIAGALSGQEVQITGKLISPKFQIDETPLNSQFNSKTVVHLEANAGRPHFKVTKKMGFLFGKRVLQIIEPDWYYITKRSIHENEFNDLRNWMMDWKDHRLVKVQKKSKDRVKVEFEEILDSASKLVNLVTSLKPIFIH